MNINFSQIMTSYRTTHRHIEKGQYSQKAIECDHIQPLSEFHSNSINKM